MFGVTLPRAVERPSTPLTAKNNPYRTQREWPPDFKKLSPKEQFRLERRYRRRAKLKYQRPEWIRGVKLATWGTCSFVTVYAVLFMDWGPELKEPFWGLRGWLKAQASSVWTTKPLQAPVATDDRGEKRVERRNA